MSNHRKMFAVSDCPLGPTLDVLRSLHYFMARTLPSDSKCLQVQRLGVGFKKFLPIAHTFSLVGGWGEHHAFVLPLSSESSGNHGRRHPQNFNFVLSESYKNSQADSLNAAGASTKASCNGQGTMRLYWRAGACHLRSSLADPQHACMVVRIVAQFASTLTSEVTRVTSYCARSSKECLPILP